jgi:aspartate carbamoyltransferase catalytic subunit
MSSSSSNSFIHLKTITNEKVKTLFSFADQIRLNSDSHLSFSNFKSLGKTGALLFFEASTRTRMSFETASARLGIYPLRLDGKAGSSLEKGETFEDTVLNVAAMDPSFLVIRCGDDLDLEEISKKLTVPILNAGWGKKGHPTQALLDAYTIRRHLGSCEGQRLLIVGDVRHSRVAASHFELCQKLGYEVAICGPQEFLPKDFSGRVFESLAPALEWSTVAMALRVQFERHSAKSSPSSSLEVSVDSTLNNYRLQYGFTKSNLVHLSSQAIIMHPGPINQGTELDSDVLSDPRCKVLDQVSHGVLVRQALIYSILEGKL